MANLSNINNKFLVTTTGEVLIGQTAAVGSSLLQVTGNSTFAGTINGSGIELSNYMQIKVDDAEIYWTNTANNDYWRWKRDASNNFICDHYNGSSTTAALTLNSSNNATFAGNIMSAQGGTAALPKITLSGSTTTGIYTPAANGWGVSTNGVSALTIDSSQNSTFAGNVTLSGLQKKIIFNTPYRYIQDARSGADYLTIAQNSFAAGIQLGFDDTIGGGFGATMTIIPSGQTNNAGNVGIGTSSPGSKLEIAAANANQLGMLRVTPGAATAYGLDIGLDPTTGDPVFSRIVSNVVSESFRIQRSTGFVGIGNTNPHAPLSIYRPDNTYGSSIAIQNNISGTGSSQGFYLGISTGTIGYVWNYENDDLVFATNNLERMRIDSGGTVTIPGVIESGGGIKLGGTATANKLNDYEEGTWNLVITNAAANMSNIAFANEKYTKIGNLVTYSFNLSGSFTSGATESSLGFNLPFTAYSTLYKSVGHVAFFIGAAPNRFGIGSIFLGTTSNTQGFIYISGREIQQSGAWGDMRITATYFTA